MASATMRPWTKEEIAILRRRFEAGDRIPDIADELGRTASATYTRADALRLKRPEGWRAAMKATMAEAAPPPSPAPTPLPEPWPPVAAVTDESAAPVETLTLAEIEPSALEAEPEPVVAPEPVAVAASPPPVLAFPRRDPLHEIQAAIDLVRRRLDEDSAELVATNDRLTREIETHVLIIQRQAELIEALQRRFGDQPTPPPPPPARPAPETNVTMLTKRTAILLAVATDRVPAKLACEVLGIEPAQLRDDIATAARHGAQWCGR